MTSGSRRDEGAVFVSTSYVTNQANAKEIFTNGAIKKIGCCHQSTIQQLQPRDMTLIDTSNQFQLCSGQLLAYVEKENLVANITLGTLSTTGIVDTCATRSIVQPSFIPYIFTTHKVNNTIRMTDGPFQHSKQKIITRVCLGNKCFELALVVMNKSTEHLRLGMEFLLKASIKITMAKSTINITKH
uniref:RVP domain-containing protein n=1 Tax=Glossina pallidipes TaxID=7398 RepID=A0A1A9ZM23_GLOPL